MILQCPACHSASEIPESCDWVNCPACGEHVPTQMYVQNAVREFQEERKATPMHRLLNNTLFIGAYALCIALLALLSMFGGLVIEAIYKGVMYVLIVGLFVAAPIAIPMAFIHKTRVAASWIFIVNAWLLYFVVWCSCFLLAWSVNRGLCVAGVLMGGVGVVPLAFLEAIIVGMWGWIGGTIGTIFLAVVLQTICGLIWSKIESEIMRQKLEQ